MAAASMATASRSLACAPSSSVSPPSARSNISGGALAAAPAGRQHRQSTTISSSSSSSSPLSPPSARSSSPPSVVVRSMAQQEKAAAANESRWQAQVREGRVKSVSAKTAGELVKSEGWVLVDVRPPSEVARAAVKGSVRAPLYIPESFDSLPNLMKHASWFGMGGWWLGGVHMKPNPDFMNAVRSSVANYKDAKIVVACQKGLRSLAAAEQLARAGYGELAWINGGLDTALPGDLEVEGPHDDLRYGGIGGMSKVLGFTDVQKEKSRRDSGGSVSGNDNPLIRVALVVLALDAAWFVWEQVAGK